MIDHKPRGVDLCLKAIKTRHQLDYGRAFPSSYLGLNRTHMRFAWYVVCGWLIISCSNNRTSRDLPASVQTLGLQTGDIALCGGEQLGSVEFSSGCSDAVKADFNLATALLHSFEYPEAEKVFARIIDNDPG